MNGGCGDLKNNKNENVEFKALTVLIPEELHREFKTIVSSNGMKLKECIIELLEKYIEENK